MTLSLSMISKPSKPVVDPEGMYHPEQVLKPRIRHEWTWLILAGVFLGISGGHRYWRDWQFQSLSKENESSPFPLKEFPKALGEWHEVEGLETRLDAEIARIAGSSDHIIRTYTHEKTGENVVVMLLYGLSQLLSSHTPTVCYPAAGFKAVPPSRNVEIPIPGSTDKALFREEHFVKHAAGAALYQQVYHSFRNAGQWSSDIQSRWRSFRHYPGMFKIQVQRQESTGSKTEKEAVEEFLGRIAGEIDRRLASDG
jgi:hypothetical protein